MNGDPEQSEGIEEAASPLGAVTASEIALYAVAGDYAEVSEEDTLVVEAEDQSIALATTEEAAEGEGDPVPALSSDGGDAQAEAAAALAVELRKQAGIIPEMVTGGTVAEVQASYQSAQKAYADVVAQVRAEAGVAVPQAHATGGQAPLPSGALGKISEGIARSGK